MIARALLAKPRLLLLDEVLDHIEDLQIGGPLIQTLFASDLPWTLVVATERDDIWPLCSEVFDLRRGGVERHSDEILERAPVHDGGRL